MLKYSGLVTAALLAAVQGSYAQDADLDEQAPVASADTTQLDAVVVMSATRTETPIDETTVSVSVISEEEIQQQTTVNTNVGQILSKTVPGFGQSNENLSDYGQSLRGRGFLTLIDGVPQTNTTLNNGRALNNIGTSAIQQIEVVRGATAAYGFGAPGGLVNIITKRPEDGEFNAEAGVGIKFSETNPSESFSYSTDLTASGRTGNFDYMISGGFEQTGSSFTADGTRRPPDSFGVQGGYDDIAEYNILAKLGYEIGQHRFEVSLNQFEYWQDSDWAFTVSGGDKNAGVSATPARGSWNVKKPSMQNTTVNTRYINEDVLGGSLELQAYYNNNTTIFTRTYLPLYDRLYSQNETENQKVGGRLTLDTPVEFEPLPFDVVWGVDTLFDHATSRGHGETIFAYSTATPFNVPSTVSPEYDLYGIAPFAQLHANVGERAKVTAGLRYELISVDISDYEVYNWTTYSIDSIKGGTVEFREPLFNISGSYDLTDSLTVFGGFSQGFTLGDLGRYLYDSGFTDVEQLEHDVQTTDSYELGLRASGLNWDASLTGFYNESDNGTTYDSSLKVKLSPEQIYGVEFAGNVDITDYLRVGGTFTWLEGRYDYDGNGSYDSDLGSDRIAPAKITGYVEVAPNNWSNFRVQALYSGDRNPDVGAIVGGDDYAHSDVDHYFVVDAFADFSIGNGKLSFGVENVLDADYAPVLQQAYSNPAKGSDSYYFVKGPGRTLSARYSVKF
ncbi:TonB-dependent receptor [Roseibium sp.]|uniref:TonB-dependent receptor n=1 Tax=Roseibium sp. TaxID=1936156 RepID=UPI003A977210